jgi:hypothetical protein
MTQWLEVFGAQAAIAALATGVFFDLYSLTVVSVRHGNGRRASGFPMVGLACYLVFVSLHRGPVFVPGAGSLHWSLLKVADVVVFALIHALSQVGWLLSALERRSKVRSHGAA